MNCLKFVTIVFLLSGCATRGDGEPAAWEKLGAAIAAGQKAHAEAILNSSHSDKPEVRPVNCTTRNNPYGSTTSCY